MLQALLWRCCKSALLLQANEIAARRKVSLELEVITQDDPATCSPQVGILIPATSNGVWIARKHHWQLQALLITQVRSSSGATSAMTQQMSG